MIEDELEGKAEGYGAGGGGAKLAKGLEAGTRCWRLRARGRGGGRCGGGMAAEGAADPKMKDGGLVMPKTTYHSLRGRMFRCRLTRTAQNLLIYPFILVLQLNESVRPCLASSL